MEKWETNNSYLVNDNPITQNTPYDFLIWLTDCDSPASMQ